MLRIWLQGAAIIQKTAPNNALKQWPNDMAHQTVTVCTVDSHCG